MIKLRPATFSDADDLLSWRNDPETRIQSVLIDPISRDVHMNWLSECIFGERPVHTLLIASADSGKIGSIRLGWTIGTDSAEVSITVAPAERGKGYGRQMLIAACSLSDDMTLFATIRRGNIASRKIFEGCGFLQTDEDNEFVQYCRGPVT